MNEEEQVSITPNHDGSVTVCVRIAGDDASAVVKQIDLDVLEREIAGAVNRAAAPNQFHFKVQLD